MSRNKNIDVFRAFALLIVMLYHCWVLSGSQPFRWSIVNLIVPLGGEIGVTAFFALSGYGIYCSLKRMEENGRVDYFDFLKKRVVRIVPHYYFSILVVVALVNASFLSGSGLGSILSHLFFVHNLFPQYHGTINGALWTMGVIVQFYLIAPFLYKGLKRYGIKMELLGIIFTIAAKCIVYRHILPYTGHSGEWNFIYGRQLFTALDNFLIGMFLSYVIYERKAFLNKRKAVCLLLFSLLSIVFVCKLGMVHGIHTDNFSGYVWHSFLALGLGGIMFSLSFLKEWNGLAIYRWFLWLARYEYGIYIWHLVIFNNLLGTSSIVQRLINMSLAKVLYIPMMVWAIFVGYLFSIMIERINFIKIKKGEYV